MQLRMFVEEAVGESPPGVQPGAGRVMRQQLMNMERPDGRGNATMVNINELTGGRVLTPEQLATFNNVLNGGR